MRKIKLILGASILLLSVQANADITSVDDSVFGTDSVTRDSVSGLDWLDITFTVNRSVADVSGQLGVGGEFEGWRYASGIEFEELLFNYTGVDSAPVYQTEEYTEGSDSIDEFIKLLGDSVEAFNEFNGLPPSDELYCGTEPECVGRGYHETHGYLADETPPGFTQLFYTGIIRDLGEPNPSNDSSPNDYSLSHRIRVHQANQHPAVGSYLVRAFSVPFPVTIDIKPGSDQVCNGVIPIAILGSDTLDVIQIDQTTLSFEGEGVRERGNGALSCNIMDANRDGYYDLVCRYEDTTTEGTLTGELLDGTPIEGADTFCLGN